MPTEIEGAPARLDAIDLVRGFVMVAMLLDHTRDFTYEGGFVNDPLDLRTTTPLLFATRWISHLCAPTFVFLAGLGAGLQLSRGKSPAALARFLWTRGLWLVFLELTVVRVIVWFNWNPSLLAFLQVIWAIGVGMIVLAALVRLPLRWVGAVGVVIVLGHNLLDRIQALPWRGPGTPVPSPMGKLWMVLHQSGFFPITSFPGPIVMAQYPILPWLGVLLAGYGAASLYARPHQERRRLLVGLGIAMIAAFVVLRLVNGYGDPVPWTTQDTLTKTVMSFMSVQKYPPSALFVLATLGPSMVALGLLDGRAIRGGLGSALVVFGRVPLFFYLLQWLVAHASGMLVTAALGKDLSPYFMNLADLILARGPLDTGGPLWAVYACWALGALLLYFPCRAFADLKARRRDWWLSYL